MSEENADYGVHISAEDIWKGSLAADIETIHTITVPDDFGITQVFAKHLNLALETMHPHQAARAASQAVEAYNNSFQYIDTSSKGSGPSWKKVAKRDFKEGPKV